MKYYSLDQLKQQIGDGFSVEKSQLFLDVVTDHEVRSLLNLLSNPKNQVFFGWMNQWKGLSELLISGRTEIAFRDELSVAKHEFFSEFKQFASPFLKQTLLEHCKGDLSAKELDYIQLLVEPERSVCEKLIYHTIKNELDDVSKQVTAKKLNQEYADELIKKAYNQRVVALFNLFSNTSYPSLVHYTEESFKILRSKNCSIKTAIWILSHLSQLHLNPEHLEQLHVFQRQYKKAVINQYAKKKGSKFQLVIASVILLLICLITWLIKFKGADTIEELDETESAFTYFTKEERLKIDSLAKIIQPETQPMLSDQSYYYDQGYALDIENQKAYANMAVKQFVNHWNEYLKSDTLDTEIDCKNYKSVTNKELPSQFKSLRSKQSGVEVVVENKSTRDIQLLVFKDELKSSAYYTLLKQDEGILFRMEKDEQMMIVTGEGPMWFPAEKKAIVFCQKDFKTSQALNTTYQIDSKNTKPVKLYISGGKKSAIRLMDVNNSFIISN